ncbi:hypothetical protein [Candidatus Symbiopectobacterium sp.]|nr:hypothetical protein [Candidatus Symbiopectobacterium sp.]
MEKQHDYLLFNKATTVVICSDDYPKVLFIQQSQTKDKNKR